MNLLWYCQHAYILAEERYEAFFYRNLPLRRVDYIEMDFTELGCEDVNEFELDQDKIQLWVLV
jgi:hypothetical protein